MLWLKDTADKFIFGFGYKENTRIQYLRHLSALSRAEEDAGHPVYEFTSMEMLRAFEATSRSAPIVRQLKITLSNYFEWVANQGYSTAQGTSSLELVDDRFIASLEVSGYFYSLEMLKKSINLDILNIAKADRLAVKDFRMEKSALLLSWYLTQDEIVQTKKSDILTRRNMILRADKAIPIDPEVYGVLEECANAAFYNRKYWKAYATANYANSEYLLRTSESEQMTTPTIRQYISYINRKLPEQAIPYSMNRIYWSGIFFRARQFEVSFGKFPEISGEQSIEFYESLFNEKYTRKAKLVLRVEEYRTYCNNIIL